MILSPHDERSVVMLVSSKNRVLDSMKPEDGQSLRSYVIQVLSAMEAREEVEFLDVEVSSVRNYVSTFAASKGRKYRASLRSGGIWVRRDA
jgi:hypothetical protein